MTVNAINNNQINIQQAVAVQQQLFEESKSTCSCDSPSQLFEQAFEIFWYRSFH